MGCIFLNFTIGNFQLKRDSASTPGAYFLLLASVSVCSSGVFLLASWMRGGLGFPLDDAWIHQVYARNLGLNGEWAFLPGQPSAGSTAPLWSLLLGLGYRLGINPYLWTYSLGMVFLAGLSWVGLMAFNGLSPAGWRWALAVGLFLALEWHLVWAAVSGMETTLQACLILLALMLLLRGRLAWLRLGMLIGLSVWVRPDGLTLLAPAVLVLLTTPDSWRERLGNIIRLGTGALALLAPYLYFNWRLSGAILPNTFFAKQAEYGVELKASLFNRLLEQAVLPLVGAGVMLLPGFIYILWDSLRRKAWTQAAGALWLIGYLTLYALRLPVTYQHGRYAMPAMPVYFVWGMAGLSLLFAKPGMNMPQKVLRKAWLISIGAILAVFFVLGADAYRTDVALIESEMVTVARWMAANTEPQALVAAHDIGALGYFADRPLLDLAGLVSPEVIPFLRDEKRLANYLDERGADYLISFPGWYPYLTSQGELIYQTQGKISPAEGGENLAVYRWR